MSKKFIALSIVLLLLTSIFAGCTKTKDTTKETTPTPTTSLTSTPTPTKQEGFKEAPALKELVSSGKIPAVEQRMPAKEDVMVEQVYKEIGQYGGDWRMPWTGIDDKWALMFTEEPLFRFKQDGSGVEPNVAKSYEVNADSTEYTIHLRKGMKWSDGQPFTADDVMFYWEHMLIPETFGKKLYDCYYSVDPVTGDKARCDFTKVDDYTFKVKFKYPSVQFLERVAIDNKWLFAPAHFYKTVLSEFVGQDKALEIAKQWGFADVKSFNQWTGYYYWVYPQRPTLRAWVAKTDPNSDRFIMERNPYYWKTDSQGNQLPYIDRIVCDKMDSAHYTLEAMAGNVDCKPLSSNDFTVLKENEAKGNYKVLKWIQPLWGTNTIQLNQTVEDPKLRALFQDIRFREAISVAVDRNEVSEIVTNGLAAPQQASVPKGLTNYQEGWNQKWAKYDVNRANQLLDEIGLKWDASHKYRTFADGSDFTLILYKESSGDAKLGEFEELLKKYYEAVGIKTVVKPTDKALFQEMKYANKLTAVPEDISMVKLSWRPDTIVPLRVLTPWLGNYGLYYSTKGKEGVKPEGDVAKILEYWDKISSSKTPDEINKWSDEIIKLLMNNMWIISYTGPMPQVIVVKNNFMNVPDGLVYADEFRNLAQARPAQFFIKK